MEPTRAKIRKTRFYNQYGNKRAAMLEAGQLLKVERRLEAGYLHRPSKDELFVCSVIEPTAGCINYGGYEGMRVVAMKEHLESNNEQ